MSEALVREKTTSVFGGMFRQISALAIGIPLLRKKSESTLGLYRVMVPSLRKWIHRRLSESKVATRCCAAILSLLRILLICLCCTQFHRRAAIATNTDGSVQFN